MSSHSRLLIEQAQQLPVLERLEMVDALLATIDEPNPKIDRLWVAEADDQIGRAHV